MCISSSLDNVSVCLYQHLALNNSQQQLENHTTAQIFCITALSTLHQKLLVICTKGLYIYFYTPHQNRKVCGKFEENWSTSWIAL